MTVKKKNVKPKKTENIRRSGSVPLEQKAAQRTGRKKKTPSAGIVRTAGVLSRNPSGKTPLKAGKTQTQLKAEKTPLKVGKTPVKKPQHKTEKTPIKAEKRAASKKEKTATARVIRTEPVKRKKTAKPQNRLPRIISIEEENQTVTLPPQVPEKDEIISDTEEEWQEIGKKDSLKTYMENISRYPLIGIEDEVRLAEMIHSADPEQKKQAAQTLIQSNLRLVVKIAHDFKGIGLPLMDLISEGNIGLMRSVYKFDPALGAKFSSYAAWWIKQSMHRALSNQTRTIRIPVQTGAKIRKIRLTREKLTAELGREPLDTELAAELNFSKRTVNMLRHAESSTFSLNDPIKSGENDTFEELIADPNAKSPEKQVSDADSLQRLHVAMTLLDDREREVINLRFFRFKTLEQVSVMINRTRERVRQIQNQALAKMRVVMQEEAEVVNS